MEGGGKGRKETVACRADLRAVILLDTGAQPGVMLGGNALIFRRRQQAAQRGGAFNIGEQAGNLAFRNSSRHSPPPPRRVTGTPLLHPYHVTPPLFLPDYTQAGSRSLLPTVRPAVTASE